MNNKQIHIHCGGCGGHYSYMLGVFSILQEKYDLSNVVFSGSSAGCIPVLLCTLNLNINKLFTEINIPFLTELQSYKLKSFYNFLPTLKKYLVKQLDNNPKHYINANNKLYCHLTHIPSLNNHIISTYYNNDDLINCVLTSGHIPVYSNCIFQKFRNNYYIDGAIYNNIVLDDDYHLIDIQTNKWRNINTSSLFISSCKDYSFELFNLGKIDALNNLDEFNNILIKK